MATSSRSRRRHGQLHCSRLLVRISAPCVGPALGADRRGVRAAASVSAPHYGNRRVVICRADCDSCRPRSRRSRRRLRHVERLPARRGPGVADWPDWVAPPLLASLTGSGIARPWSHQREAMDLAHARLARRPVDRHRLGQEPGLPRARALRGPRRARRRRPVAAPPSSTSRPTKALAADQLARIEALAIPGVRAATYDGDTPTDERRWIREHANVVLTNPDLLHHSLLPGPPALVAVPALPALRRHRRVPHLPRRLRLARLVGAAPAAAGVHPLPLRADVRARLRDRQPPRVPRQLASSVCRSVPSRSTAHLARRSPSPCGSRRWSTSPAGRRRRRRPSCSPTSSTADVQTLAFARSRAGVEALASSARRRLGQVGGTPEATHRGIPGRLSPAGAARARARAARR